MASPFSPQGGRRTGRGGGGLVSDGVHSYIDDSGIRDMVGMPFIKEMYGHSTIV